MNKFILWFTKITGYLVQLCYFRRKTYYVNKKSQGRKIKGSAIIISNHTSVFDVALCMFLFFNRSINILVAEIMFQKTKIFAWYLKKIGAIKVDRVNYDFGFIGQAINVLNNGGIVEIYPEGRLPIKGETKPLSFKPAIVYIALESKAPIIPIYTDGSYGKKKRANVIIGEKIYLSELVDPKKSDEENIEYLNNYLRQVIIQLGEQLNEKKGKKA